MRNIKMILEYDGSRYQGWQRLGDSDRTIQGKLEEVISQMTESKIEIIGSGRTDAGVHARAQVANFKTISTMEIHDMQTYMNRYLPQDLVVKELYEVQEKFNPDIMQSARNIYIIFGIIKFRQRLIENIAFIILGTLILIR